MLIVRLIPGSLFAIWNYGAGVARVPFGIYFLATLLGTLPAHFVFAYSADALFSGTMTEKDAIVVLAKVGGLLIALSLIPTAIKRLTKRRADAVRPYR